jgi:hypothetical protein
MIHIFAPQYINRLYAIREPFVASINRLYLGVLLLALRIRHFPFSYEGVHVLEIGVDE